MATIRVFSADGVKELECFDTLEEVPFLLEEEEDTEQCEDE